MKAPTSAELTALAHAISQRLGRYLEGQGLRQCDAGNTYLSLDGADEGPMNELRGHSISYRIAVV